MTWFEIYTFFIGLWFGSFLAACCHAWFDHHRHKPPWPH